MNNVTKILLTIYLEGGTLVRKSEPEVINYVVKQKHIDPSKKYRGRDGEKVMRKGSFNWHNLEPKIITQHINITYDAYEAMTSDNYPQGYNKRDWLRMSKAKRIQAHMELMCEYFGGKSFDYEVLND